MLIDHNIIINIYILYDNIYIIVNIAKIVNIISTFYVKDISDNLLNALL